VNVGCDDDDDVVRLWGCDDVCHVGKSWCGNRVGLTRIESL